MCKKILATLLALCIIFSFTGCGIIRNDIVSNKEEEAMKGTNDSRALQAGRYYIWHDENQKTIDKDINTDIAKFSEYTYNIFNPAFSEFNILNNSLYTGDPYRIIWMLADIDDRIPTFYEGDELIFYSDTDIPSRLTLERYYDHGYSVGIYGLAETIKYSGVYTLSSKNTYGLKINSTAAKLANALNNEEVVMSIPYIGDKRLTSDDISKSGTIRGLKKNSNYKTNVYIGTDRYEVNLVADTRIFSSMEEIPVYSFDLIGNGIMRVNLPSYLKDGYYCINGVGFFRYVKGTSYSDDTDFNDPIILVDSKGTEIYNPIKEQYNSVYTNYDAINDSKFASSALYRLLVNDENDTIVINTRFKNSIEANPPIPEIHYYQIKNEEFESYSRDEGTYSNPYVISLTEDEIKKGQVNRTISGLNSGNWIFEVTNIGSYKIHKENFQLFSKSEYEKYQNELETITEETSAAKEDLPPAVNETSYLYSEDISTDDAGSVITLSLNIENDNDVLRPPVINYTNNDIAETLEISPYEIESGYINQIISAPVGTYTFEVNSFGKQYKAEDVSLIAINGEEFAFLQAYAELTESENILNYLNDIKEEHENVKDFIESVDLDEIKTQINLENFKDSYAFTKLGDISNKITNDSIKTYLEDILGGE